MYVCIYLRFIKVERGFHFFLLMENQINCEVIDPAVNSGFSDTSDDNLILTIILMQIDIAIFKSH